jgi:hypothetical protein
MSARPASTRSIPISFAGAGDNTVVAAVVGNPIRVYGIVFTVGGATNITFKDGTTALSGAYILTGNGSSLTKPLSEEPYYTTTLGNGFVINSTNAVAVGGTLWYTTG